MIDLEPATRRTAELVRTVPDDRLDVPTPCRDYILGDLLDHIGGLAPAFTGAAKKEPGAGAGGASGDASRLGDDWRTRIPAALAALAYAWREPEAWSGMTEAGGVELPGEVAGLVALNEVVIHGWDVARALGVPYECDTATLEVLHGFVTQFAEEQQAGSPDGPFGTPVAVPADAPLLDRVVGLTGRNPNWKSGD